ncbi:MAG: hypothetical protein KJ645_04085 [Planctomycetes bacterium]|nr:hypothetical protein [Planctomycetota bacterium]
MNRCAKKWIRRHKEKPFFMWLHYYEVHAPYRVTEYARKKLGDYHGQHKEGISVACFYECGKTVAASKENLQAMNTILKPWNT